MRERHPPRHGFLAASGLVMAAWLLWLGQGVAADPPKLQIGVASKIITHKIGGWVQGAGVPKKAMKIRDELEANALYLDNGETQVLIASLDLAGLEPPYAVRFCKAMGEAAGIPARNILLSCTHTHGGPSVVKTNYLMPLDSEYLDKLEGWLVELAKEAVKSVRPGKIGWGKGSAQIGYNRRVTWADGTHSMHGDTKRKDFAGLEGPDDPQHMALFAADENGKVLSVLYHNTTHPTIFYAAGVYSSDFAGETRNILREEFGDIPVLFLNGAQGDIAMADQLNKRKEGREEKLERIGRMVADETLRLYKEVKYHKHPILAHTYEDMAVQVRLPDPKILAESRKILAQIDAGENVRGMKMIMAFGTVQLQDVYEKNPVDALPIHAVRIGDVALVTQPCELYCQFGLDIKRRSPAPITAVVGLTDGYAGYCPTIYGVLGGGYSGQQISWTRLEPNAGYMIVESAAKMLNSLWHGGKVGKVSK